MHEGRVEAVTREGRLEFLSQFRRFGDEAIIERQLAPHDRQAFDICKLDHRLDARGRAFWDLHKDLLALRRTPVSGGRPCMLDGAVLNDRALVLRYRREAGDDYLLGIDLGPDLNLATMSEPLVAPPMRLGGAFFGRVKIRVRVGQGRRSSLMTFGACLETRRSCSPQLRADFKVQSSKFKVQSAQSAKCKVQSKLRSGELESSRVVVCEGSTLPEHLITSITWRAGEADELDGRAGREWLVTNGLGGYASGSVVGAIARRYHGLLIAALPAPLGRVMMFNHVSERVRFPDRTVEWLSAYGLGGKLAQAEGTRHLVEFRLEAGIPTWRYQVRDAIVERTVFMPYGQNTVYLTYRLVSDTGAVRLALRPLLGFRPHEAPVESSTTEGYTLSSRDRRIEIQGDAHLPMLRLVLHAAGGAFTIEDQAIKDVKYLVEQGRGYGHSGPLWSPGYFRMELTPDSPVTLIASTEAWDMVAAVNPDDAAVAEQRRRDGLLRAAPVSDENRVASQLVLAADQFVTRPTARVADEARARGGGNEARTIIAGYHWFTDWGRDTMISLEGLALLTGRHSEACNILRTFAWHVRDGLIPNLFPEGQREGLYHTADATLWFFHALSRYETVTGDTSLTDDLIPKLIDIVRHHQKGTRFGIRVAEDGLLQQGAADYPLTWMDAKMDGWVVTPRRGKAVEINALWYNAQCLLGQWLRQRGDPAAADVEQQAVRTREAFNRRFWNPRTNFLFDVVDGEQGDDEACRPNQVFALSLPNPVLDRSHWEPVLEAVRTRLLTPFGLRSLAPGHPDYKPRYFGDLRARDAAYHQGTVWSWLIGPFIDAWLALYPRDREQAAAFLEPLKGHLFDDGAIGSVSEIFDAEPPYTPRGCIAQAWSVAELLRADARTSNEH